MLYKKLFFYFGGLLKFFWHFISTNTIFLKFGGIFIIFYTLYFRFIRPRATGPIDVTYTEFKFYLYIFLICTFFLTLIIVIITPIYLRYLIKLGKNLENKNFTLDKTTRFVKIQKFFIGVVTNLYNIYEKMLEASIAPFFHKHFEKHLNLVSKLLGLIFIIQKHLHLFINVFYFLPPAIISFTYFIEVIIFKEFTYFPYVIFLMIFPISIRILLYSTRLFCNKLEATLNLDLKVHETLKEGIIYAWTDNPSVSEEYKTDEVLQMLVNSKHQNLKIIEILNNIRFQLYTLPARLYFQIFSLSCWLSSFSFQLYLILLNK